MKARTYSLVATLLMMAMLFLTAGYAFGLMPSIWTLAVVFVIAFALIVLTFMVDPLTPDRIRIRWEGAVAILILVVVVTIFATVNWGGS